MFIKDNVPCGYNFTFVRNPDSEDIRGIIADEIAYIGTRIELPLPVLLQLRVSRHGVGSATVGFQMNYLRPFVSSEKAFFNIRVEDFIWCFPTLSFPRGPIVEIYSAIDDLLPKIVWKTSRYSHCTRLFHDYTPLAFCGTVLVLGVRRRRLKVDL